MATREFEFKDATSDKFWKITLNGHFELTLVHAPPPSKGNQEREANRG
jgi:hypothetical protein